MDMNMPIKPLRRPTNVTLDAQAVDDAKALGLNVSQACERGLLSEIKKAREARWIEENWDAIQSSNAWVEKHGLPFAKYRMF
jgi:antitoxin CcdA